MPSWKRGREGGFVLRAQTFGMVVGVKSQAFPMRMYLEPGCMTTTCEPRLRRAQLGPDGSDCHTDHAPFLCGGCFSRGLAFLQRISSPKSVGLGLQVGSRDMFGIRPVFSERDPMVQCWWELGHTPKVREMSCNADQRCRLS